MEHLVTGNKLVTCYSFSALNFNSFFRLCVFRRILFCLKQGQCNKPCRDSSDPTQFAPQTHYGTHQLCFRLRSPILHLETAQPSLKTDHDMDIIVFLQVKKRKMLVLPHPTIHQQRPRIHHAVVCEKQYVLEEDHEHQMLLY